MNGSRCISCSGNQFSIIFTKDGYSYYRCGNCGLEMILPQPSDSVLEKLYDASYYKAWNLYGNQEIVKLQKKKTFENLLKQIPVK